MKTDAQPAPSYPHNPIVDCESLALLLGTSLVNLQNIAESASSSYRPVPQTKKDGSLRMTYDAYPALKRIQLQIVKKILRSVRFPRYLHGGIRDTRFPRDHVSNAALHTGATVLILDDIKDFYSSLDSQLVFAIWLRFFGFSPEVSELLTRLTTRKGVVPQGASTSSYLANLAFWDREPRWSKTYKVSDSPIPVSWMMSPSQRGQSYPTKRLLLLGQRSMGCWLQRVVAPSAPKAMLDGRGRDLK